MSILFFAASRSFMFKLEWFVLGLACLSNEVYLGFIIFHQKLISFSLHMRTGNNLKIFVCLRSDQERTMRIIQKIGC